jgi:hypothetical protein
MFLRKHDCFRCWGKFIKEKNEMQEFNVIVTMEVKANFYILFVLLYIDQNKCNSG